MASILDRIKLNAVRTAVRPTETVDVIITDIRPTQQVIKMPNGTELRKVMVVTKDHGNFFPFENAIANPMVSFGDGVKAKLFLQENNYTNQSTGEQVEGLNCTRVVLEAIDSKTEAMIKALPKGGALFAM